MTITWPTEPRQIERVNRASRCPAYEPNLYTQLIKIRDIGRFQNYKLVFASIRHGAVQWPHKQGSRMLDDCGISNIKSYSIPST
ncbi:MAG: hypothetical protein QW839_05690 [Conexivisphaerales archaeon]